MRKDEKNVRRGKGSLLSLLKGRSERLERESVCVCLVNLKNVGTREVMVDWRERGKKGETSLMRKKDGVEIE